MVLVLVALGLVACSEHPEATAKCKNAEVDAKCEICCAENGASGFTYFKQCTCLK